MPQLVLRKRLIFYFEFNSRNSILSIIAENSSMTHLSNQTRLLVFYNYICKVHGVVELAKPVLNSIYRNHILSRFQQNTVKRQFFRQIGHCEVCSLCWQVIVACPVKSDAIACMCMHLSCWGKNSTACSTCLLLRMQLQWCI